MSPEVVVGRWRRSIDAELEGLVGNHPGLPAPLREPIHYSLTGEGKRLRGLLLMASYAALGGRGGASGLAAALEVVHAYSLVHDDLPCMDDDSMRRGRPTTHRAHGVPAATLAGVAMVPLAVQQLLHAGRALSLDGRRLGLLVATLMRASGGSGMVGGQLRDLMAENRALSAAQLEQVHRAKTGALITASLRLGGIAAGGDARALDALTSAGDALGLAFQIADDVLDATASSEALGKTARRDVALAKSTYATALGIEGARRRSGALVAEAMDALDATGLRTPVLEHLARFVASRQS